MEIDELEKNIRINRLFDIYGNLLTPNQKNMLHYYYQMDLSLGEIADQENISRNAVYDALKKGVNLLEMYEEKLELLKRQEDLHLYFEKIKKDKDENTKKLIEEIEERMKL